MTSQVLQGHTLSEVCLKNQGEETTITSLVEVTNNKPAQHLVLVDAGLHDHILDYLVMLAPSEKSTTAVWLVTANVTPPLV